MLGLEVHWDGQSESEYEFCHSQHLDWFHTELENEKTIDFHVREHEMMRKQARKKDLTMERGRNNRSQFESHVLLCIVSHLIRRSL
ncbi:hypothetical protein EYC80_001805 [Monilinia laxa]|uniref:Uncharacterized protein n=1 Tax=Monilinia laxa TaxID=61186 RepID=A0A5N6K638_MONLA|nr:hypothetical protein EYC80_001805 [Monilinia laxa]